MEARSLPPNIKGSLLAKLREYKTDLNNLKNEVKRISFSNVSQASRDELLESGMADAKMVSTDRLNQSTDRIKDSRRTMLETEELGVSILQDLHQQRQALLHANNTLQGVDSNIGRSSGSCHLNHPLFQAISLATKIKKDTIFRLIFSAEAISDIPLFTCFTS
ncbi:Vesicle transport v-SNARE 11 [Linum perenne]